MSTAIADAEPRRHALESALRDLEAWGHARAWLGTDPYEGLNARRPRVLRSSPLGRRLLIQGIKRMPVDVRPLVGIRPEYNAVGVAQVAMGYCHAPYLDEEAREARLMAALDRLIGMRRPELEEAAWSYHFDVETRAFFYPRTMPNTIATAWAGHALLDGHEATGRQRLLDVAAQAGEFFLRRITQTPAATGAYFGYFVGDRTEIHNANLLACGFLARLAAVTGDGRAREAVEAGVSYAISRQAEDGSWVYGEPDNMRWIDGFHTGYNLDSLWYCLQSIDSPGEWRASLDRGLDFYAQNLFEADGTARYYVNRRYPIDMQSIAQGIRTFALTGRDEPRREALARLILERGLATMRRDDGAFRFQRRRLWSNPTPHMRWAQAPMFEAMRRLLELKGA